MPSHPGAHTRKALARGCPEGGRHRPGLPCPRPPLSGRPAPSGPAALSASALLGRHPRPPTLWGGLPHPPSLRFHLQSVRAAQAILLSDTIFHNISFICQNPAVLYLMPGLFYHRLYYYPETEVDEFQFHYQDLSSSQ